MTHAAMAKACLSFDIPASAVAAVGRLEWAKHDAIKARLYIDDGTLV